MLARLLICTILFIQLLCSVAYAQSLRYTTFIVESIIPYAYASNQTVKGVNVEILLEALAAVNMKRSASEIHIYPWARAYQTVVSTPNTCIISMVRNPERENLFKWAGPIADYKCSFITKKGSKANTLDDFKKLKIAAIRKAVSYDTLLKMGFDRNKVDDVATIKMMVQKLRYDRVNMIFSNPYAIFNQIKLLGLETESFEIKHTVDTGKMYCAFNNQTDEYLVRKLQHGINIISQNGTLDQIINKYKKAMLN